LSVSLSVHGRARARDRQVLTAVVSQKVLGTTLELGSHNSHNHGNHCTWSRLVVAAPVLRELWVQCFIAIIMCGELNCLQLALNYHPPLLSSLSLPLPPSLHSTIVFAHRLHWFVLRSSIGDGVSKQVVGEISIAHDYNIRFSRQLLI
jgi:hypothetical protein